ncbi:hypothetical protein L1N85_26625 [Paenibacillus alkaliterrae]|uniref:hypothetical protein n=1 Tax=Paenibacillus alkaliterrae TaxID=320909 RepID=UPI001F407702|nr:hypothetical protein [Paenibacillus alkaliterrae]MCF2941899.1 hypothetical protein [Paenibacillus alkaliterrae]
MDEFEKMMSEINESTAKMIAELKASRQFDPAILNAFKNDVTELISIKHEYADKLSELRASVEKEVVRLEYSKGGETIHRGYYCPSPVLDLIVGGKKRGRLFKKKIPEFGSYSYEYGFDKDDRLIRVKGINEFTTPNSRFDEEYLIYRKNIVYGVEFDHLGKLHVVSKCAYNNGNIIKYEQSVCWMEIDADLYYEEYTYENNKLSEVHVFYNIEPLLGIYSESRYLVDQDEDAKIIRLTGGKIVNDVWQKDVYEIR